MIEINGLYKFYHHCPVLNNVSLSIPKGVIMGLIGPNGAGKTTLISILIGIVPKDRGTVMIDHLNIETDLTAIRSKSSMVPQTPAFYPMLTAHENLKYFGALYGLTSKTLKRRIEFSVELSGLNAFLNKRADQFSGGMARRLNLAIGLLNEPEILYLDEPTVGVDAQARNHILEMIKKINTEQKTTIIYASHYMEEIERISDVISIIDQGKMVLSGYKESVLSRSSDVTLLIPPLHESDRRAFEAIPGTAIGDDSITVKNDADFCTNLMNVLSVCKEHHITIRDIKSTHPNLEDVFFRLTGNYLRDE